MRAWLDGAQTMQAEATEFLNARAGKDMAALSEWSRCKTPTDALEMRRATPVKLFGLLGGSQKMMTLLAVAGRQGEAREVADCGPPWPQLAGSE